MKNPSVQLVFSHLHEGMSDEQFMQEELRLCVLADELGYDSLWIPEHHFDREYSMCPDNFQVLAYLAGRTKRIGLTLAAAILPWNDPLRVAEKINLLDIMAPGRVTVGFGRGLSRSEYATFGIDMNESRGRWQESAHMVLEALKTGRIQGDGKFYKQPPAEITPYSGRSAEGRLVEIAMSPDSVTLAAEMGAKMATFVQFPIEQHKPLIDLYKETYQSAHAGTPPSPVLCEFVTCHQDSEEARRLAYEHHGRYFTQLMRHYELAGDHFAKTSGYESYAVLAEAFKAAGMEDAANAYIEANTYGTPDEVAEKIWAKRQVIGDYDLSAIMSFGAMPFPTAENSMRLFAEKVFPQIEKMNKKTPAAA